MNNNKENSNLVKLEAYLSFYLFLSPFHYYYYYYYSILNNDDQ